MKQLHEKNVCAFGVILFLRLYSILKYIYIKTCTPYKLEFMSNAVNDIAIVLKKIMQIYHKNKYWGK